MNNKFLEVPVYVADEFSRPQGHPSKTEDAFEKSVLRIYFLINEALEGIEHPDWEVGNRIFHSKNDNEPYGFEFTGDKFYIYIEERGHRTAIAIFKMGNLAAKFFVWLVTHGERTINWELFLEMEP